MLDSSWKKKNKIQELCFKYIFIEIIKKQTGHISP